jgi:hypothetical protein
VNRFEAGGKKSNDKWENPNVKAQMSNEIQISKPKVQMKRTVTDTGHGHGHENQLVGCIGLIGYIRKSKCQSSNVK